MSKVSKIVFTSIVGLLLALTGCSAGGSATNAPEGSGNKESTQESTSQDQSPAKGGPLNGCPDGYLATVDPSEGGLLVGGVITEISIDDPSLGALRSIVEGACVFTISGTLAEGVTDGSGKSVAGQPRTAYKAIVRGASYEQLKEAVDPSTSILINDTNMFAEELKYAGDLSKFFARNDTFTSGWKKAPSGG